MDKTYDNFIKLHNLYENKALRMLLKEFRTLFKEIKFKYLTFNEKESKAVIELNLNREALEKIIYKIHYSIGKEYGNLVSRQLRKQFPINQKKWKPLPFFNEVFQKYLINYFSSYGGMDIILLSQTMSKNVVDEIIAGTYENETLEQMQERIYKTVNKPDFYKWQALRIARTETSAAMNSAKYISGNVSGVAMQKVWIGRNDGRERQTHLDNNGKAIDPDGKFTVGQSKMRYPGDRENGSAKEVVNCRCTIGWEAKRDESRNIVFNDDDEIDRLLREDGLL